MSKGIFYSVGVGPGDPQLMTFKAARTIEACGVIAIPESGGSENVALGIAGAYVGDKPVLRCDMPMVKDSETLRGYHDRACALIRDTLNTGESVAFLTLGDPSVYSTAMYIHERLDAEGYETRMVPGVPSFCAAAASLNSALCSGGQPLHIIPASYGGDYSGLDGVKVLMKSGKALGEIIEGLRTGGEQASVVCRASMEGERVFRSLEELPEDAADYFSIVVVKQR